MNQSDAERISSFLSKNKLKQAASVDEADLVIFVTCGVRQSAEDRVYGQINNIKKKYPERKIVLTGCLAHRKDVQRRLKGKVDLFCGIKNFPQEMKSILDTKYQILDTKNRLLCDCLSIAPKYANPYTVYVPIMTGCNNFCAYCVVPYARGREYSRPAEDILKEVKGLVKKGYKEIMLLGQNVNSYYSCHSDQAQRVEESTCEPNSYSSAKERRSLDFARDDKATNFPKLLQLIEKIPGNFWLTFLTSHPKDMSDELINTITKSEKICEYISLPAQSGDDEILRKMNRKYTIEHYKNLIKKIRKAYQQELNSCRRTRVELLPAISTDIIVGFPGETEKQFENTAKLLREMKFDMAYIAQYSPRPETAAWRLKDNVSKYEKARREKVLTDILSKTALENNKKYIGKIVEVLVDREIVKNAGALPAKALATAGHTRTQKRVIFHSDKKIPVGSFAKVKITKAKAFGLEGEIL